MIRHRALIIQDSCIIQLFPFLCLWRHSIIWVLGRLYLGPDFSTELFKKGTDFPGSPRSRFLNRSKKLCPTFEGPRGHLKWWFASLLSPCLVCLLQAQRNFRRRTCYELGTHPGDPRAAGMALPFSEAASSPCGGMGWNLSSLCLLCGSWTTGMRDKGQAQGKGKVTICFPKGWSKIREMFQQKETQKVTKCHPVETGEISTMCKGVKEIEKKITYFPGFSAGLGLRNVSPSVVPGLASVPGNLSETQSLRFNCRHTRSESQKGTASNV